MAYQFSTEKTATFKVVPDGKTSSINIKGVNSNETDAQIIVNGVASLLAIGNIDGIYNGASRVVTEDVNYEDEY